MLQENAIQPMLQQLLPISTRDQKSSRFSHKPSFFKTSLFSALFALALSTGFTTSAQAQSAKGLDNNRQDRIHASCDGVFVEQNGLVIMEVESAPVSDDWTFRTDLTGYTGTGYYEWKYDNPNNVIDSAGGGILTYPIQITQTGVYRFLYRTAAPHPTEHNDAFIRFRDNEVEARTEGGDVIDLGQDTWFKVYQGRGNDEWNYAAHTEDGPHQVYALIDTPGTYRLEVSGRSTLFKMDRMSLYHFDTVSYGVATNISTGESQCLLPVELTSFSGLVDGDAVALSWTTASELNNAGFDVEFSTAADGEFSKVGFVPGNGVSEEDISYQFRHTFAGFEGQTAYYRLKQVDFDGAFEYSDVVAVNLPVASATRLHPAYPNPFNPTTTIAFTLPIESEIKLTVYDAMGRQVKELFSGTLPAGYHTQAFQANDLANGTYMYRLETGAQVLTGSVLLLK